MAYVLALDQTLTRAEYLSLSDESHREILASEYGDDAVVVRSGESVALPGETA